ncbi:MAG: DUF3194 domain-containing protein [Natronomonas sp.]
MTAPSDETVVQTASDAAEGVILSEYKQSSLRDFDVTVRFEDGTLEIDVYLNPPDDTDTDPDAIVESAIEAAEDAVDDLFSD